MSFLGDPDTCTLCNGTLALEVVKGGVNMDRGAEAVGDRDGLQEQGDLKEAGRQKQNPDEWSQPMIPKHSYWLDLWLFIALDLVLFLVVYFMP
ncbi:PREDICTED: uncharacterized protein C4orf3-like [Chrysochloris asiatica]|uniref:Uncharacterized protein C4orf3-like n=1 Tax=Chrysochloris asiatica TaxID=185453 RepID=A0A9B0WPP2_CHRAS|nr:PREDICTED: uncharacterized protein C4orf3-like [Chrysochloris asiatica]